MGPEDFCRIILSIDKKIEFVGLYKDSLIYSKMQDGLENLLTEEEIIKSFAGSAIRYSSRRFFESKLGDIQYTLTKHDKGMRVTIPLNGDDLLLFHTKPDDDIIKIIGVVFAAIVEYKDKLRS